MTTPKIKVPEGMLKSALDALASSSIEDAQGWHAAIVRIVEESLLWLSENPILPNEDWAHYAYDGTNGKGHSGTIVHVIGQWQRQMFLEPNFNREDK